MLEPTHTKERIVALDFLRGFAILGILIMNIISFSMPGAAYFNPAAYGDFTGLNKLTYVFSHVFGDQKFMTIFTILYGAGIVMISQNAEKRTGKSASLHYKRTFWLLIIGLIHAHLIWYGDILVPYALCAFFIYLFRNRKPLTLLIWGLVVVLIHTVMYVFFGLTFEYWSEEMIAGTKSFWSPSELEINQEIQALTSSLSEQIKYTSKSALGMETFVFFLFFIWRVSGLMMVGMALFKWGILTAKKDIQFYKRGFLISWLVGMPIVFIGLFLNFKNEWSVEFSTYIGSEFNYIGSILVGYGYICLIMWFSKIEKFPLRSRFAAVGQMALTNYIVTSIICIFIFYGIGLGLFGQVSRLAQLPIMVLIWIILLAWSKPWLKKFRYGPLEWVWRSLTYGKIQSIVREK